jgi:hypothetical protein
MKLFTAGLVGIVLLATPLIAAEVTPGLGDNDAGTTLTPGEAAGAWTVESDGRAICVVQLTGKAAGAAGFGIHIPTNCGGALPATSAGWAPAAHGMNLMGPGGQILVGFNRWSDSLLVSHRSSGVDVQLRRGGANP